MWRNLNPSSAVLQLRQDSAARLLFGARLVGSHVRQIMRNIEDTGQSTSFRIFCPRARLIFLIASRRAMASGSLSSIYKMVEILGWQLEYSTITMEQVRREFELEYKAKVDTRQVAIERAVKDFADPTV
ncbi:hypothetical protein B0H14DRAFT_2614442 [Mycena olivaceomarginata]|nr:hypothetical protein B0H14DRAFT_2614442 [Mycena olivaceomarginata]